MLKKSLISLFIIGCTASYAGTMGPVCEATDVTVPCEIKQWEIGGHALYLQPFSPANASNLQNYTTNNTTGASTTYQTGANSSYNWGFQLEAGRHFGKGKDINLNWYHFRGTTNKNYPAFSDAKYNTQSIQENASWDHANLEYGNLINLEETTDVRVHAGFVYARVAAQYIDNYKYDSPEYNVNVNTQSEFSGFGVRGGMALIYHVMPRLNLHGDIAAGVLAGTTKASNLNWNTKVGSTSTLNTYSVAVTAPEIDAKAGIASKHDLKNGQLMLDAGWLWATYINTLNTNADRSFGIQGLYFGARWIGNIA